MAPLPGIGFVRYANNLGVGVSVTPVGTSLPQRTAGFALLVNTWASAFNVGSVRLVKTNAAGGDNCTSIQATAFETSREGVSMIHPNAFRMNYMPADYTRSYALLDDMTTLCYDPDGTCPTCKRQVPEDGITVIDAAPGDAGGALLLRPNPIAKGSTFELPADAFGDAPVDVVVSDMSGAIVLRSRVEKPSSTITLGTAGWATGTYLVKATSAGISRVGRVVVTDR